MNVSAPRKVLIASGLVLLIVAMGYGLWYALFAEHQELEGMGRSLAIGFAEAASGRLAAAQSAIQEYGQTKYNYVRHVDVHSHWGGLAMILIVLGVIFDRVGFTEKRRLQLAVALVSGSVLFPLGVVLQTVTQSRFPSLLALAGSVLVIASLAITALGFSRNRGVS